MNETDLIRLDTLRLEYRKNYRDAMLARASAVTPDKYTVYFPPMHFKREEVPDISLGHSWLYNGFIIAIGNRRIVVDPGVDFLFRLAKDNYDLAAINTIFISHAHIDHYGGAGPLLDWLIRARKVVITYAPASVFSDALSSFHAGTDEEQTWKSGNTSRTLGDKDIVRLNDSGVTLRTFQLYHGEACLGFTISSPDGRNISYISDTGYAKGILLKDGTQLNIADVHEPTPIRKIFDAHEDIIENIEKSETLIVNIDSFMHNKNSKTHLSVVDLVDILPRTNIKKVILAHINPCGELAYDEWGMRLAKYVSEKTGRLAVAVPPTGKIIKF